MSLIMDTQAIAVLICILYMNPIDGAATSNIATLVREAADHMNQNLTARNLPQVYVALWRSILKFPNPDAALRNLDNKTIEDLLGLEFVLILRERCANTYWVGNERVNFDNKLKLLVGILNERGAERLMNLLNGHLITLLKQFSTNITEKPTEELLVQAVQESMLHAMTARYKLYVDAGVHFTVLPSLRTEVARIDANVIDLPELHDTAFNLFRSSMPTADAIKYMKLCYAGLDPLHHFDNLLKELNAYRSSYQLLKRLLDRKLNRVQLYKRGWRASIISPKIVKDLREFQKDDGGLIRAAAGSSANFEAITNVLNRLIAEFSA